MISIKTNREGQLYQPVPIVKGSYVSQYQLRKRLKDHSRKTAISTGVN